MAVVIEPAQKSDVQPLSEALRACTAKAHEAAEGSDFMARVMSGEVDVRAVATYTGQLWFVYDALERAVRSVEQAPLAGSIVDRRLERRSALEADLAAMLGANWREEVRILPATSRYVGRLEELTGQGDVSRILAHHYVRYLGDVSGGQVIATRLKSLYGFDDEALNFYDFSQIGKIPPYRNSYRAALDALPLDVEQRNAMTEEAVTAFHLNTAVFAELNEQFNARLNG